MEQEKPNKKWGWLDFLILLVALLCSGAITKRLGLTNEMYDFLVQMGIMVVLLIGFYLLKYLFMDKKE